MRVPSALAVLAASFLLPLAHAGSREDPEVTDAEGDAALNGVALPAWADWDVTAAWFEPAEEGNLTLFIAVAGEGPPPSGEVGVTFRVGDQHFIAGYTVVPPVYSGGFLSRSDEAGDVPADEEPSSASATFADGLVTVLLPVEFFEAGASFTVEEPWGWSESRATNGERERLDRTEPGRPFAFGTPGGPDASGVPPPPARAPLGVLVPLAAGIAAAAMRPARVR